MSDVFDYSDAELETGCRDRQARLVRRGGKLVAIIVRLDDEIHGACRGMWNLEVGFGRLAGEFPAPFPTLAACNDWLKAIYRPKPVLAAVGETLREADPGGAIPV